MADKADKIEREIEDILRKIDDFVPDRGKRPPAKPPKHNRFASAQGWFGHLLARVSLSQVMMWSLIVIIAMFFLRGIPVASWAMIGALIILATAFMLSIRGGGQQQTRQRWRGQTLDLSGPSYANRLKAWLKGRKRQ